MTLFNRPPRQSFSRLSLERLEARDVPTHWWAPGGSDLSAATPGNWLTGPGVPYAPWTIAPDSRHHVIFDAAVSNQPCVVPASMAPPMPPAPPTGEPHLPRKTFTGMHLQNGYQGTVTLNPAHMGVDQFTITSGAISQPATTLTVGLLNWTGGTINNSPTPGFLNLAVAGIAAPTNAGTVNLGSTFTLLGNETTQTGATLDVLKGTITLLRGDAFVANAWSQINFKPEPGLAGKITIDGEPEDNPTPEVTVKPKAKCEMFSINRTEENEDLALVHIKGDADIEESGHFYNFGQTTIRGLTEVKITPAPDRIGGYLQNTNLANDAVTSLEAGSKITCEGSGQVNIDRGRFEVKTRAEGGQPVGNQIAKVSGGNANTAAFRLGEEAVLSMPDGLAYNTLLVEGIFRSEGEVKLAISGGSTDCDKVRATKAVEVDAATSKLTLRWVAPANEPVNGHTWELMESMTDQMSAKPPTITTPDPKITVDRTQSMTFLNAKYTR